MKAIIYEAATSIDFPPTDPGPGSGFQGKKRTVEIQESGTSRERCQALASQFPGQTISFYHISDGRPGWTDVAEDTIDALSAALEARTQLRVYKQGQATSLQGACLHAQACKYAAYLQNEAVKQQLKAASGFSLPLGISLMGMLHYGRQLYVRPSYLQLRNRLAQLSQNAGPYGDKTVMITGTPGIGKSFCAIYLATCFIAHGTRVVYEFHPINGSASSWYHFPPYSCQGFHSYHWGEFAFHTRDADTVYLVDGGLPWIPSPVCWCYAFSSPQRGLYRWQTKSPSAHLMFLPLWTLDELQACRLSVDAFISALSTQSVTEAYEIAGGVPRTVLQLAADWRGSDIPVKDLVIDTLDTAVRKLSSQALQDAVDQSLATGFHDGIDKILHMACHNLHEYGAPQIVYATRFAAQLVLHKLGEAARQRRLSYLHSAAGHAHSQVARGYWFEKTAHQALSNGGKFPFRLLGSDICYTLQLPRASVVLFTSVMELAPLFQVDSMATYAQPKYSNHPTFDALSCGALWFQITVAKQQSQKMAGVNALKAAGLPACRLNNYVDPPLIDDSKPIHMIVTTPDRFDTCYHKQTVQKRGTTQFQTGVLKLDLSAAFDRLRLELGKASSGLDDLEAMAIDADVQQ